VLTSASLAADLRALAPALDMSSARIETVETLRAQPSQAGAPALPWHPSQPEDVFLILFTSGSTGVPKGVMLTHRNVLSLARGYTRLEGLSRQEVTFNWMPLDHIGGLVTFHLRDVYLGCRQIHARPPTILQQPLTWLDCLDRYRVTCTWAPNFAFRLITEHLASGAPRRWDLSALHYILGAGEAIVPRTARRFLQLLAPYGLPASAIHPSWGMSETASGVTFSSRFSLVASSDEDRFVDVGTLIPGVWVRVVDGQDQVVSESVSGRLQVKGPTVTPGYYHNPDLNREAFTADGWLETGDVGMLRQGRLTITGRAKDILIINGLNYSCHEIEAVVEEVSGVEGTYTAACGVRMAGEDTDELVVVYCSQVREEQALVRQGQEIRRRVVSAVGINPLAVLALEKEAIPKTQTGKIQRGKLKEQFEAGGFDELRARLDRLPAQASQQAPAQESVPQTQVERQLLLIWQRVLGIDQIDIHDNFFDLGGDSLVSMRMVALARDVGLQMTQNHVTDHQTIAELAAALDDKA
jgi:acyl-CoA synthetase (AMP-forming)/AMP-acid ligase II/acyl carrier protein